MNKFQELKILYEWVRIAMSAVCSEKGLDIDNYSGRFFAADLLEMLVAFGKKANADVSALEAELSAKRDLVSPTSKPIYEMTLAEFERAVGISGE